MTIWEEEIIKKHEREEAEVAYQRMIEEDAKIITDFNREFEKQIMEHENEKSDEIIKVIPIPEIIPNRIKKILNAIKKFTDTSDMAREFIDVQPLYFDKSKIWWLWNYDKNCWEIVDDVDILNALDNIIKPNNPTFDTISQGIRGKIIESLEREGRKNRPKDMPKTWIQFNDEIVDINDGKIFTATSEYMATNPIPWKIGLSEETPILDNIFEQWVGKEYIKTLYEIMAYCLIPDYPIQRIFCFVGAGSNGKSTFLAVLTKFLGHKNICSTELDLITDSGSRFETAKLYKKLACVMGETNFNSIKRTNMIKRLTGRDSISFEFKNKTPFDDINYAKILIATNRLPTTYDNTEGFYRRWLIIEFPNQFTEKKDILSEIPDVEYQNLSRKCIRILKELITKRSFTNEGNIIDRQEKYERVSNPILSFIDTKFTKDPNARVPFNTFRLFLGEYLKEPTYKDKPTFSDREISKMLELEGFETKTKSYKKEDGTTSTRTEIMGLKLKEKI